MRSDSKIKTMVVGTKGHLIGNTGAGNVLDMKTASRVAPADAQRVIDRLDEQAIASFSPSAISDSSFDSLIAGIEI